MPHNVSGLAEVGVLKTTAVRLAIKLVKKQEGSA